MPNRITRPKGIRPRSGVETDDSNVTLDLPDMCEDDIQNDQNDVESDEVRVALANLIANLKFNVDKNKKIQKQLKKANTTLAQELKECKAILAETSKSPGESISVRDSCLVALQTKQTEFKKYKAFNDRTIDYDKLKHLKAKLQDKNIAISELKKLIEKGKGKSMNTKFDKPSVVRQPNAQRIPKPSVLGNPAPFSNSLERIYFSKTKSVPKANVSEGLSKPVTVQTLPQTARHVVPKPKKQWVPKAKMQWVPKAKNEHVQKRVSFAIDNASRITNVLKSTNSLGSNLLTLDAKYMTGNLKLLYNFVERFLGTVRFGNNQFAPILGYGDMVQGNVTINRVYYVEGLNHNLFSVGQFCDADLEFAFRKST
nr:integrase, catalytic region, zinc finger, CCHC-type, peptidase aspartic, catalytic [Tanacetum cinerariifolium]